MPQEFAWGTFVSKCRYLSIVDDDLYRGPCGCGFAPILVLVTGKRWMYAKALQQESG